MKKKDLILIGIILAIAFAALGVIQLFKEDGAYVVVKIGPDEVARYSLSVDGEYSINGGTNVLKIENGEAWMLEASCPTRGSTRCTAQGKISKTTESITCQPYNISVVVYGGEDAQIELVS
jgi:hypothetical protein